jgi:osmoprotectant transport system ATP-binding protein
LAAEAARVIRFRAVSKRWAPDRPWALRHLDLEIADGEWLALIGASGGGKSTTLKLVNRMVEATEGVVEVRGRDVHAVPPEELRRGIGYVPQALGLLPHWTVGENVGIVPRLLGWAADRIRARTDELLHDVGLDPELYRDRTPRDLSGGQSQRVAVARALAASPGVLLMDEPFGAVDPVVRDRLQELVRGLHDRLNLTTVFVTHDMGEALRLADRVAVVDQGKLVRLASPRELLASPGHPAVAALLEAPKRHADALARLLP